MLDFRALNIEADKAAGRWFAASGASGLRTWWVCRWRGANGLQAHRNSRGVLIHYATWARAQRKAFQLNGRDLL